MGSRSFFALACCEANKERDKYVSSFGPSAARVPDSLCRK
jgi:hypothetical protein